MTWSWISCRSEKDQPWLPRSRCLFKEKCCKEETDRIVVLTYTPVSLFCHQLLLANTILQNSNILKHCSLIWDPIALHDVKVVSHMAKLCCDRINVDHWMCNVVLCINGCIVISFTVSHKLIIAAETDCYDSALCFVYVYTKNAVKCLRCATPKLWKNCAITIRRTR